VLHFVLETITVRSDRIQVWIIKRRLSTYLDGKVAQQPEPSFLNENGPIKPDRSLKPIAKVVLKSQFTKMRHLNEALNSWG
jgi:hypothetical protein